MASEDPKCRGYYDIMVDLTRRKWRWIGHVLREESGNVCREDLFWTPEGKRQRGRPKLTGKD